MTYQIPESITKRHTAIVGMTGSGKSSTERLIVELVVAQGARVCVLDTVKSDWWGITSSRNGKAAGLPFKILGGPRGHVNIGEKDGKIIGQLVGSGKLPLSIIDMADFGPGGLQRFFADFAASMWKNTKGVVYLVIEEAHEVAPKERAGFGAENIAIHWAKKLATGSRTKGIRLVVATQRVQSLHNAVLSSCETIITHRIGFKDDQDPVIKWMKSKIGKENAALVERDIANLQDGEGFIAAGVPVKMFERVKFPMFKTFDNTKTPENDDDLTKIATAPVDVGELKAIIGEAVEKEKADDPRALRAALLAKDRRIAELERTAGTAKSAPPAADPAALETAEKRGFERAKKEAATAARDLIIAAAADIEKMVQPFAETTTKAVHDFRVAAADRLKDLVRTKQAELATAWAPSVVGRALRGEDVGVGRAKPPEAPRPAPPARDMSKVVYDVDLPAAAREMLVVLDTNPPVKRSWSQVASLSGRKARGGSFNKAKTALQASGLIVEANGLIQIREPSASAVDGNLPPAELVEMWASRLSGGAPKVLRYLFEIGGRANQLDVASALNIQPKGGSWNKAWKELRDNDIVVVTSGEASLTEMFSPN